MWRLLKKLFLSFVVLGILDFVNGTPLPVKFPPSSSGYPISIPPNLQPTLETGPGTGQEHGESKEDIVARAKRVSPEQFASRQNLHENSQEMNEGKSMGMGMGMSGSGNGKSDDLDTAQFFRSYPGSSMYGGDYRMGMGSGMMGGMGFGMGMGMGMGMDGYAPYPGMMDGMGFGMGPYHNRYPGYPPGLYGRPGIGYGYRDGLGAGYYG